MVFSSDVDIMLFSFLKTVIYLNHPVLHVYSTGAPKKKNKKHHFLCDRGGFKQLILRALLNWLQVDSLLCYIIDIYFYKRDSMSQKLLDTERPFAAACSSSSVSHEQLSHSSSSVTGIVSSCVCVFLSFFDTHSHTNIPHFLFAFCLSLSLPSPLLPSIGKRLEGLH